MASEPQLLPRTKEFARRVLKLVDALPTNRRSADVLGKQLLRSATSVGANYRAACRARSTAEFCAKMGIVEEEADESVYWLELLGEGEIVPADRLADLSREANEILAMVVASIRTARKNMAGADGRGSSPRTPHSALRTRG
ncbi:MAG TPA: four helix bundle protein [Urbifossiella sp.]|jgi:four helix bundle protein|nr:four helix bundle protein [Urbifossiella sp.]